MPITDVMAQVSAKFDRLEELDSREKIRADITVTLEQKFQSHGSS